MQSLREVIQYVKVKSNSTPTTKISFFINSTLCYNSAKIPSFSERFAILTA